jgi:hypothetical protein
VKIRDIFAPLGAVLALGLALVELFQPTESRLTRLSPGILIVIAALMGARTALRRQARKREEMLKAVPQRPLGLDKEN